MKNTTKFLGALLALAMVFALTACKANYEWNTDKLPKPSSLKGKVYDSKDGSFDADIECSEKYFQKYIEQCRNSGFNAEEYHTSDETIHLYNADGSKLALQYANDSMFIGLRPPITLGNDEWPNEKAAALKLPKPKSDLYGHSNGPHGESAFRIYVGNTSHSDFNDYIEQCKDAGFNNITYDEPIDFEADNGKCLLVLTYVSLNVMCVTIGLI